MAAPIINHTVVGTSTLSVTIETGEALVFVAGTHQGDITSVAFNGDAMTEICAANTAFNETVHIFYLETPDVGTYNLTWSASGTGDRGCALVISGQASGQPVGYNTDGNSLMIGQVSPADNTLYIAGSYGEASLTMDTDFGLTERDNYTGASYENFACASGSNDVGGQTFLWSQSSGQRNAVASVAIKSSTASTLPIIPIGVTSNSASTGTDITVAKPTGTTTGDFIIVALHTNGPQTITDNNGSTPFTQKISTPYNGPSADLQIWHRVVGASDPSTYSFTANGSNRWAITAATYRGVNTSDPYDVDPSANTGSGTTITCSSIVTTVANTRTIAVGGADTSSVSFTGLPGDSYATFKDVNNEKLGYADKNRASAGTQSAVTYVIGTGNGWIGYQFALAPAETNPTINVSDSTTVTDSTTTESVLRISTYDSSAVTDYSDISSDRYWVGNGGNWSDAATHWALSSGGTPDANNLPTATDNVIFDANSGTGTVTVNTTTRNCRNFDASNSSILTFYGTYASGRLDVYGDFTLKSGITWDFDNGGSDWTILRATTPGHTVTTAGVDIKGGFDFAGIGGAYTLQDNLTSSVGGLYMERGTLDLNEKTLSVATFYTWDYSNMVIDASNSDISITGASGEWRVFSGQTVTLTGSSITFTDTSSSTKTFTGGNKTYNDVTFDGVASLNITGTDSFANLSITGIDNKATAVTTSGNLTVTGTFTLAGHSATSRMFFYSSSFNTVRTITAASVSLTNVDFRDITGAGAATWSGTSLGNCLGNSNITFTTADDIYWVATSGGNWDATSSWSDTSNGTPGYRVPLPQDTVHIDQYSITSGSSTISVNMPRIGCDIDFTGVLNSPTVSISSLTASLFGNLTLVSGISVTGAYTIYFYKRGTQTLTAPNITFPGGLYFYNVGGSYTLSSNLNTSGTFSFNNGVFNANNYNITASTISFNNSGDATYDIYLGSGLHTISSSTGSFDINSSGAKLNTGTATIYYSGGTGTKNYRVSCSTNYVVDHVKLDNGTLQSIFNCSIKDLEIAGGCTLALYPARTLYLINTPLIKSTPTNLVTLKSYTDGSAAYISKTSGTVDVMYMSIRDSTATGGATWNAINSTSVSNNTGWNFLSGAVGIDETTVTEGVIAGTPSMLVYDSSNITESVSLYRSSEEISTYDTTSVTENVNLYIPTLHISVSDTTSVTESNSESIPTLHISTYDETTVSESNDSATTPKFIYVYDESGVTDTGLADNGEGRSAFDESTVTEYVYLTLSNNINVNDKTYVTDLPTIANYAIPRGVIFLWPSTAGTIPSGWERVSSLDSYFIKGTADATNPDTTTVGGATTHTHSSSSHDHTMANHTHTITLQATGGAASSNNAGTGTGFIRNNHNHADYSSGNPASVTVGGTAVTYASVSNNPPYYEFIFITPTVGSNTIPDQVIYFYEDTDSKTGHYICDGTNSTPNLLDKFIKGAAAGSGGGGTGGSSTNIHDISHSHTVSHTHTAASSGASASGCGVPTAVHESVVGCSHTHSVSLNESTTGTATDDLDLTTTETVEPAYTKLLAVQNRTGSADFRRYAIGLWIGSLATIPTNYNLLNGTGTTDMRSRYPKITTSTGSVGGTGGANSHTHASQNHDHASVSHLHVRPVQSHTATSTVGDGSTYNGELATATHAQNNSSTDSYTLNTGSTSAASSSNEPQYKTVAFVQLDHMESSQSIDAKANILSESIRILWVYDSSSVTDAVAVEKNSENAVSYDTTAVTDSVSAHIPILHINVSDNTTATDATSEQTSAILLTSYEATAVTDSGLASIPILHVSAYENTSVTDSGDTRAPSTSISVSDSSTVTDSKTVSIPTLHIYVNDTTTVTESNSHLIKSGQFVNAKAYISNPVYPIPYGTIFLWNSTEALIPTGWSRVSGLDGKFPRIIAAGETINATGGNATHTHSSPSHSHSLTAHTHTFTLSGDIGTGTTGGDATNQPGITKGHTHGSNTTSGAMSGSTNQSQTVTYSAYSNNPPYYELIFITPTIGAFGLPDGVISIIDDTTLGSLTLCDGNNSTPNLLDTFIRGAATGNNAGGTGGSSTNTHTIDHTHTNTHGHSAATTAAGNSEQGVNTGGSLARNGHTHSIALNTCSTITSNNNSSIGSQAETVLPPYINLVIGQNRTGSALLPMNSLAIWLGSESSIPYGWSAYTKEGKFIRGSSTGNKGTTGGSTTHSHAAEAHTHTITGTHTHTTPNTYHSADVRDSSGGTYCSDTGTYHASVTSSSESTTVSLDSQNTTGDTTTGEAAVPEYRNVLLIQLDVQVTERSVTAKGNIVTGHSVDVNDSSTVTDYSFLRKSEEDLYKYENTTVTEFVSVSIPTLHISVNDGTTVTDASIVSKNSENINVSESTTITDTASAHIPVLHISVYEETIVTDLGSIGGVQEISAKASILVIGVTRTIEAKASLMLQATQTIEAKAYMTAVGVQYISAKGSIYRVYSPIPTFGGMDMPCPSEVSIAPSWEDCNTLTLDGTSRMGVMARKYIYTLKWDTMSVSVYNDIESIVNTLDYSTFIYHKFVQSRDGVDCLGSLSPRQLVAGIGDSAYYSSVILILEEVNSRI